MQTLKIQLNLNSLKKNLKKKNNLLKKKNRNLNNKKKRKKKKNNSPDKKNKTKKMKNPLLSHYFILQKSELVESLKFKKLKILINYIMKKLILELK